MENYINDMIHCDIWKFIDISENIDQIIAYIPMVEKPKYIYYDKFIQKLKEKTNTDYEITYNDIITIHLISKYKEEFLSKTLVDIEKQIYDRANEIINIINSSSNDDSRSEILIKKIITFNIMFIDWKEKDKKSQLDILSEIFFRYNEALHEFQISDTDEALKTVYIGELNTFMNNVLYNMKRLDNKYKDHLYKYKFKNIEFDNNARKYIYNNLVNIFWKNIEYRLRILKDYTVINLIIDSYIDLYIKISLDEDYLDDILELKNSFSLESVYLLIEVLINNNQLFENTNIEYKLPIDNVNRVMENLKLIFKNIEELQDNLS